MVEFTFKKHVNVVCNLSIGDSVRVDGWGKELDGKDCIIEDIKFQPETESSVVVKVDKYDGYLDSNWIVKSRVKKFLLEVQEIITDEAIDAVFFNTNFGTMYSKREIVANTLLKCASGYYTGFTAKSIVQELGLVVSGDYKLTSLGQKYLFAAYSNGVSI